jgi:monoamine oxidase
MDILPLAFEKTLQQAGVVIFKDAPVISIKSNDDYLGIQYRHSSGENRQSFDRAICAIPLTTLRNINIEPGLSDRKRALIDGVRYASVSRAYIQCKQPILDLQNSAGYTDLPIGNLLDMSFGLENGPGRVLQGFMIGKYARDFANKMDEREKNIFTMQQLTTIFPQLKEEDVEKFWYKCWDHDPWARGAYPAFTADQFLSVPELGRAEGRLHFAGEHTSAYSAWMEGALRSGNRAAREIDPHIKERQ